MIIRFCSKYNTSIKIPARWQRLNWAVVARRRALRQIIHQYSLLLPTLTPNTQARILDSMLVHWHHLLLRLMAHVLRHRLLHILGRHLPVLLTLTLISWDHPALVGSIFKME